MSTAESALFSSTTSPDAKAGRSGRRRLDVLVVHPTVWPEVRRGTERFIHEYSMFLSARGHRVTVLSSTDGPARTESDDGYRVEYRKRLWRPWMQRAGLHEYHVFPATALWAMLGLRVDAVHCFNFTDALAAVAVRRWSRARILLHLANLPPEIEYRRVVSTGGRLLKRAVDSADEVLTVSAFQRKYFEGRTGSRTMRLIHPPVDTDVFRPRSGPRAVIPTILFASAAADRRKGIRVLFRAFERLRSTGFPVRLKVASNVAEDLRDELLALLSATTRNDVEFLGLVDRAMFPALLAEVDLLALPSLWESFPLVAIEALASGTPVAGSEAGGIPELLSDPATGVLFDPGEPDRGEPSNATGLADALATGLAMSRLPETQAACRSVAERMSWKELGPRYEEVLYRMTANQSNIVETDAPLGRAARQ